jgi:septum formation protein
VSFVLASSSPRRKALLAGAGLHPTIDPPDVDESIEPGETPIAYALRTATKKAMAKAHPLPVLAADTVVAVDGVVLGKSETSEQVREMLRALSGRTHFVHTGVVVRHGDKSHALVVTSSVRVRSLTEREIEIYVETQEALGKAGGYGIQGHGGTLIAEVHGSYSNIVGLPLEEALGLLALVGVRP